MTFELMNATKPQDLIIYVNTVTDGWFSIITLILIFMATFVGLGYLSVEKSFAGAAWLTFIMAGIMFALGILSPLMLFISIVLLIAGALFMKFTGE